MRTSPQAWLQVLFYNRAIATITNEMLKKINKDKLEPLRAVRQYWETERNNLLIGIEEYNTRTEVEIY